MAKIIETEDGARMLVSDEAPDDIAVGNVWNPSEVKTLETVIAPSSVLLCFTEETFPIVPIQINKFSVQKNVVKLYGLMLFSDYAWLLTNIETSISHLEIRTEDRAYNVAKGSLQIASFVGKDINATTVNVYLSLKRDI